MNNYIEEADKFAKDNGITLKILGYDFKSMPWDDDGQKRNVFKLRLSRKGETYDFEYGSSVAESCKLEPKLNTLIESDKISLYSGVKSIGAKNIYAGISYELTKSELLNTPQEIIEKLCDDLEKAIYVSKDIKNEKIYKKFEEGDISRKVRDSQLIGIVNAGLVIQCIQKSIKAKIKELEEEQVFSKDLQSDIDNSVCMYDVLACLTKYCPDTFEDFCNEFGYDTDSRKAEKTFHAVLEEYKAVKRLFGDIIDELQDIN